MNESNQRGTPPLKLSFFPFFLSLLLSRKKKKKSDDLARDDGGGARASRQPRARDPTATQTRARVEAQTLLLLFVVQCYNSRRPIFFCVVVQRKLPNQFLPTTTKPPFFTVELLFGDKKKGGDFYGHGQKCSLSLCVVIKSSLRPPLAFFSPFFSSAHQEQQQSSCVVSDTFWTGSARRRPLFLSLSLGVPFLSRSRAKGAKNVRARALNRTRRAGESLAPVGASELARARGEKPSPEFCVRANPKERVCWFPRVAQKRRGKERKVFCNRSLSCARACVAHGLSIYSSIDRSIGKEEQK